MRNIYLDIQTTQSLIAAERGIPRYAVELTRALLKAGAPVEAIGLNPHLDFPEHLPEEIKRARQLVPNSAASFRRAARRGPMLFHMLSPFEMPPIASSAIPRALASTRTPVVSSLYDVIPAVAKYHDPGTIGARRYEVRSWIMRSADLLLSLSESSRRDAVEHLDVPDEKIVVVGAAASDYFRRARPEDTPATVLAEHLPAITKPFLLTVTGWERRKNPEVLFQAFARLPADVRSSHQLVLACRLTEQAISEWTRLAEDLGLGSDEFVLTGSVSDEVLRALYQEARLFAFTSLYEGFGLPVLEAARCGCPALTSNTSALPEVLEWPEATFSPSDPDEIGHLVERGLRDDDFRRELVRRGDEAAERHTWDKVAERVMNAYERLDPPPARAKPVADESERRYPRDLVRLSRMRVALVGPFAPARSGVAMYNERLAVALAMASDLTCFVETPGAHGALHRKWGNFLPTTALGRNVDPASFDAILYTVGNSWFHHETLELALKYPGGVWFHDVDLAGLYIGYARRHGPDSPAVAETMSRLAQLYGDRLGAAPPLKDPSAATELLAQRGVLATAELACAARFGIVSTRSARERLIDDLPQGIPAPPLYVLPLAAPDNVPPARHVSGADPLILVLGRQHHIKEPGLVLEAVAQVARTHPVRLAFVGEGDLFLQRVVVEATRLGLGNIVEVTGWVDDREYREWIARASVVVRLGSSRRGEASAVVNDALAAGVPVLADLAGDPADLPGGVHALPTGVTAELLARELIALITHPAERAELCRAAYRYASEHSFRRIAMDVLRIVASENERTSRRVAVSG